MSRFSTLLSDLSASCSAASLRQAVIHRWAESQDVSLDNLQQGGSTASFLTKKPATVRSITRSLRSQTDVLTLKDVERSFEHLLAADRQTKQGAFYTPNYIIDYLLDHSLSEGWQDRDRLPRICDPACGSAGFLIRAARKLEADHGIAPETAVRECLVGIDNDPWAITHAECLLELYLAARGVELPGPKLSLVQADTLLTAPGALLDKAGFPEGFDAVVTNPPYVKLQNLEPDYREELSDAYSEFVKGSFGIAPLFLIMGLRLIAPDGWVGMITQNNLFTSLAGGNIRAFLQGGKHLRRIVDFKHRKVFSNASAYTCLIFLSEREEDDFEFESLDDEPDREALQSSSFSTIRFDQLDAKKWRLAKGRHFDNLMRLESTGIPLGDLTNIKVGFATLKDAVFTAKKENGTCLAHDQAGRPHEIEPEATRPALKIADVEHPSDVKQNTRRIIFPYRKKNGKHCLIPETDFKTQYPQTHAYLCTHRDVLAGRDKGRKKYADWYAWGRTQGREAPGPKLLTKTFNSEPRFFYDESDQLFCNGYAVSLKEESLFSTALPLQALQRILNSSLMHYYAKLTSFQIEGNYQCYQKNFIERFGIVNLNDEQTDELLDLPDEMINDYVCRLYDIRTEDVREVIAR